MKQHKHAELIKAWADGKPIEVFSKQLNKWLDVTSMSAFDSDCVFRMKDKEPVVRWLWVYLPDYSGVPWRIWCQYLSEQEAKDWFDSGIQKYKYKKLEWSRQEFDK